MIEWIPVDNKLPDAIHPEYGDTVKLPGVPPEWWESDPVLVWYEDKETGDQNYGFGQIVSGEDNTDPSWFGVDCLGDWDLSNSRFVIKAWMPLPKPYANKRGGSK